MKTRAEIKANFEDGDYPDEDQFEELIDAMRSNFEDADYTFKGVAIPATTPIEGTVNTLYVANTAGTYTNFGGLVVAAGEVAVMLWTINPSTQIGAWTKMVINDITNATIFSATIIIPHEEILTLHSLPVTCAVDPGADKAVKIIDYCASIEGVGGIVAPYATNVILEIITDTATDAQISEAGNILTSTIDRCCAMYNSPVSSFTNTTQIIKNKSVVAKIKDGDPTGGVTGQTLTLNITYRIIDL